MFYIYGKTHNDSYLLGFHIKMFIYTLSYVMFLDTCVASRTGPPGTLGGSFKFSMKYAQPFNAMKMCVRNVNERLPAYSTSTTRIQKNFCKTVIVARELSENIARV